MIPAGRGWVNRLDEPIFTLLHFVKRPAAGPQTPWLLLQKSLGSAAATVSTAIHRREPTSPRLTICIRAMPNAGRTRRTPKRA